MRPPIVLTMIVKDEAPIIERCIRAAAKYASFIVVVDTGSTDATVSIVRKLLEEDESLPPGLLKHHTWRGFGDAKTAALAYARQESDGNGYALVLDADEILAGELPEELTHDRYHVWYQINNVRFTSVRLFKLDRVWRYVGVLHEFPTHDKPWTEATLDLTITTPRDGARSKNPNKYAEDAEVLRQEINRVTSPGTRVEGPILFSGEETEPLWINGMGPARHEYALMTRYVFYLAQSYRDAGKNEDALRFYLRRAQLGGGMNWEEIYCALLEAARMHERLGDMKKAEETYLRAAHQWPDRAEALRRLHQLIRDRWNAAEQKQPVGSLFVESSGSYISPKKSSAPRAPSSPYRLIYGGFNDNKEMLKEASNLMEELFYLHGSRADDLPADKWHHFLSVYHQHLEKFENALGPTCTTPVHLLEIGVQGGGMLQIWRRYLGQNAVIHGIDNDPACTRHTHEKIHIGNQVDHNFLTKVIEDMGGLDIVIDDASHVNSHQIATFETLFPLLSEEGVYICEDVHTSYWPAYGGGNQHPGSFMEHVKKLIDKLHAWYLVDGDGDQDEAFARATNAIHFYDSIVVIEKCPKTEPKRSIVGHPPKPPTPILIPVPVQSVTLDKDALEPAEVSVPIPSEAKSYCHAGVGDHDE